MPLRGIILLGLGDAQPLADRLMEHTEVRALSFTGSTAIGRLLLGRSAESVKKVSMELGGHAPFILFDDAPLDLGIRGSLAAKLATSGQDCLAANRIYVQRGIYERFVSAFAAPIGELKVGHGLAPQTDIGPMTRASVAAKCNEHLEDALRSGARRVTAADDNMIGGNFVRPTLLADVSDTMLIAREETFGPVAAVLPFDDEDEVIRRANATEMGLASYFYTNDLRRPMRLSERLEFGMVGVNTASFTGPPIPYVPLSAAIVGEKVYQVMEDAADRIGSFSHGYTYSGHPIAAAAANAVLDIVENERLGDRAKEVGGYFQDRLKDAFAQLPIVGEVRGVGMLGALEFVADRESKTRFDPALKVGARISKAARDRGLIARAMPHGDILGFAPPLVARRQDINDIVAIAAAATKQVMDELAHETAIG